MSLHYREKKKIVILFNCVANKDDAKHMTLYDLSAIKKLDGFIEQIVMGSLC